MCNTYAAKVPYSWRKCPKRGQSALCGQSALFLCGHSARPNVEKVPDSRGKCPKAVKVPDFRAVKVPVNIPLSLSLSLSLSGGFVYECPGAVLWAKTMTAILTKRKLVRCSGPPSVYNKMMGGMLSIVSYLCTRIDFISAEFCNAEEGSLAVILRNTYGCPLYQDSLTSFSMSCDKTIVGASVIDEKSWSADLTTIP